MRTVLAVPLLREGELLGTFAMIRTEVRPFSDREIELVKTFADQAVIAIENVRLFDEVQARTAEVSEALKQQTATADVLKVISRVRLRSRHGSDDIDGIGGVAMQRRHVRNLHAEGWRLSHQCSDRHLAGTPCL